MLRPSTRLIEQWRERGDDPEVGLAGEATLLGRRTQIVELRPSTGGVVRRPGAHVHPALGRRWHRRRQSYRAEVTALDYDTKIDASRSPSIRLQAPAKSKPDLSSHAVAPAALPASVLPRRARFLRPAYTPERY